MAGFRPIDPRSPLAERLSGDLDGVFAEVVADFEGPVYTTALRLSGRAGDAEDLAAETFLRAYAALRTYPAARIAGLQLRPWLITICLNQWRNQVRAATRRPVAVMAAVPEVAAAGESPESRAERHEEGDDLARALLGLPPRARIAVVLRHIVGLSPAEIADVLACPEGTARSHISRGLDQLRRVLVPPAIPATDTNSEVLP